MVYQVSNFCKNSNLLIPKISKKLNYILFYIILPIYNLNYLKIMSNKAGIETLPKFFDRYIAQVADDITVVEGLKNALKVLETADFLALESIQDYAYAAGKWTIKELLQHLIDTERILAYRALRFARKDNTELAGFDENHFVENSTAKQRTFKDLLAEFYAVRQSTIYLFQSFDEDTLAQKGLANKVEISVLALGFAIIGHQNHHLRIIQERYL